MAFRCALPNVQQRITPNERVEREIDIADLLPSTLAGYDSLTTAELAAMGKTWRMARGYSLRRAAALLGTTFGSIWQYERGRKRLPNRIWEAMYVDRQKDIE